MSNVKPIEQKAAQGTLRGDRIPKNLIKPKKLDRIPKAPSYFDKEQKKIWNKYCDILLSENRLNTSDLPLIELLCNEWDVYYKATTKINDLKDQDALVLIQFNQGGQQYETTSQWLKIRTTALEKIQKLSADMGLSPASRNRVGLDNNNIDNDDPIRATRNRIMNLHANSDRNQQVG